MNESYTRLQVARQLLHCRKATVQELIDTGKLRAFRVGRRLRISAEALREYERTQAVAVPPAKAKKPARRPSDWVEYF